MNENKIQLNFFSAISEKDVRKILKTVLQENLSLPKDDKVLIVNLPAQWFEITKVGHNKYNFGHYTEPRFLPSQSTGN